MSEYHDGTHTHAGDGILASMPAHALLAVPGSTSNSNSSPQRALSALAGRWHSASQRSAIGPAFQPLHMLTKCVQGDTHTHTHTHAFFAHAEYKPEGWAENVPAKKDLRLYRLPEVLVLHIKRFNYTPSGGYMKLHKPVVFEASLRLKGGIVAEDSPDR